MSNWSKTPPTEPGVYQVKDAGPNGSFSVNWVKLSRSKRYGNKMIIELFGTEEMFSLSEFSEWLGPIQEAKP